jgi:hypothetical protein
LPPKPSPATPASGEAALALRGRVTTLLDELLAHDGFGALRVEVRILRRGQKEVIVDCGKQYRYVVDTPGAGTRPARSLDTPWPGEAGSPA